MQRTAKITRLNVVEIIDGKPETLTIDVGSHDEKEVEKIVKKHNGLPLMDTAKKLEVLYKMDDEFFFANAEKVSETEVTETA